MRYKLLAAFVFISCGLQAQQINPVPDYVFQNRMSVGRNAVTDTLAYFSIGPRYGAIRGFMPPMVVDTALVTGGTKRNGLTIFSIQKNKYVYWDSVGSKWAEMAGTGGSAINSGDTASMLSPYIRAAGYGLTKSSQSLLVDTAAIATRARVQKAVDSINGNITLKVNISDTSTMLTNYVRGPAQRYFIPRYDGDPTTRTITPSQIYDNGTNVTIGASAASVEKLYVRQNAASFTTIAVDNQNASASGTGSQFGLYNGGSLVGWFRTNRDGTGNIDIAFPDNFRFIGSSTGTPTERARINTSGELLIGTTSDAGAYALQVTGAIYNTTTLTTGAPTSGSAKPWRLGEAATVSPTSPNRTIRVEIDGTVYYIHAKTTND